MSTTQSQTTLPAVSGHWWALALRGAIAILFGLAALLRPGIALEALILLFGAYAFVDGVFAIVGTFGQARGDTPRWLLFVEGLAGILAGVIAFILPGLTAVVLLYLIAAWAIITGVSEIAMAIRLRQEIRGEWALILGGALSILFGVLLAVLPAVGVLSLVWLIGVYAVAFGILMVITAFQVRGRQNSESGGTSSRVT
ncbi:MAG: HdeD family acid-resistance protein [Rubrobacter sp.]